MRKSRTFLLAIAVLTGSLTTGVLTGSIASAAMLINAAGSTFGYPIYSRWFSEYTKVDPNVRFNYQSIGSGGGIN
ncbi:MAG: phosphate ABC transporter substrate-binding protein PstS, partial [Candidatus Binataceae bacterium]